jgi:hypothetical protein
MIRHTATIIILSLTACNNGRRGGDSEGRKIAIPAHLPQAACDTFYYEGILRYVALSNGKQLDSMRHEITKLYLLRNSRFGFQFKMSNYLPFLADLGNPDDTFSTVPYEAVYTIGAGKTFNGEDQKEGFHSRLQFLQGDSLFFDEEWTFRGHERNEHWTFKGKRIK